MIRRAKNKIKTTWKIINREKGANQQTRLVSSITLEEITISDQSKIANTFNNYFVSAADTINLDKNKGISNCRNNPIDYLHNFYSNPFLKLKWKYA
jgi:hypothetical protein